MADSIQYREKLSSIEEIPAPDELISGTEWRADTITISTAGEYERGTLLMTGSDGFVKATSEGIASANELCILCDDVSVPEGAYVNASGYFSGTFKGESVVLFDDMGFEAIRPVLRQKGIYIQ